MGECSLTPVTSTFTVVLAVNLTLLSLAASTASTTSWYMACFSKSSCKSSRSDPLSAEMKNRLPKLFTRRYSSLPLSPVSLSIADTFRNGVNVVKFSERATE